MHPYYYFRNGQGDIIGLFDGNGNIVARYSYDSWGNLLKITDGSGNDKTNDAAFVGYKNPLRYRGYYYDSETKLYYLQSRYYNPVWGRFLNADGIIGANGDLTSNNLFAYCSNNPVMFADPSGYLVESISFNIDLSFIGMGCFSIALVWDHEANMDLQFTGGIGGSAAPKAELSIGYSRYDTLDTVDKLAGESAVVGGEMGPIGYSRTIMKNPNTGEVINAGYTISMGVGTNWSPSPANGGITYNNTGRMNLVWDDYQYGSSGRNHSHKFSAPHYAADLPPHMVEIRCIYKGCGYRECYYATAEDYARMK